MENLEAYKKEVKIWRTTAKIIAIIGITILATITLSSSKKRPARNDNSALNITFDSTIVSCIMYRYSDGIIYKFKNKEKGQHLELNP
jgi:hypothetical protein